MIQFKFLSVTVLGVVAFGLSGCKLNVSGSSGAAVPVAVSDSSTPTPTPTATPTPTPSATPAYNTDVVGLWRFEEDSGSVLNDSSGNGNYGTIYDMYGGLVYGATGIDGNAYTLDEFEQIYFNQSPIGNLSGTATESFSVQLWFKTNNSGNAWVYVFGDGTPSMTQGTGLMLETYGTLSVNGNANNAGDFLITSSAHVDDGAWHHSVVTYDAGTTTLSLYLDGALAGSVVQEMHVVQDPGSPNSGIYANGTLDELAVWNKVLSSDDITSLYNGGVGVHIDPQ